MHRLLIALFLLLALPFAAAAQDETVDFSTTVTGDYDYEASTSAQTYTGTLTISGTGPVYTLSYADVSDSGVATEETIPALSSAPYVVSTLESPDCSASYLLRQSDGGLFGGWLDTDGGSSAVGMEYAVPQEPTTDFVGTYSLTGTYTDGSQYTATVEITQNEGGWYNVNYTYHSDEKYPDDVEFTDYGVGLARGRFLGVSFISTPDTMCGVYVAEFAGDGTYAADFVGLDGLVGTETGTKR